MFAGVPKNNIQMYSESKCVWESVHIGNIFSILTRSVTQLQGYEGESIVVGVLSLAIPALQAGCVSCKRKCNADDRSNGSVWLSPTSPLLQIGLAFLFYGAVRAQARSV